MEANRMVTYCVCVTWSKIIENLHFGHTMHSCIWYDALNKQQFFHWLTNYTPHNPSSEATSPTASQEITCILSNPKEQYCFVTAWNS